MNLNLSLTQENDSVFNALCARCVEKQKQKQNNNRQKQTKFGQGQLECIIFYTELLEKNWFFITLYDIFSIY